MRTNIELDDTLLKAALKITHSKTKKQVVHLALQELVAREKRKGILKLEGRVIWKGSLASMRRTRKWS